MHDSPSFVCQTHAMHCGVDSLLDVLRKKPAAALCMDLEDIVYISSICSHSCGGDLHHTPKYEQVCM